MPDVFKLTAEEQAAFRAQQPELAAVAQQIAKLKAMGLDVSEQEQRLDAAQKVRAGFLEHFGSPTSPRT